MFLSILGFEIRYRIRRPATWIYLALTLAFGLLVSLTDVARIGGAVGKVNTNAPFILQTWIGIVTTFLGFFLFSAIMSVPIYRDFEHQVDRFLYAYPLRKGAYLGGRLVGSLLIAILVICGFPGGMMLGEAITRLQNDPVEMANWGPFNFWAYVLPVFTVSIPNLLALGSVYFTLPTLTRKIFITYVLSISILVLYSISGLLLQQLYVAGYQDVARLLDPFGFRAFGDITEYWSIADKNGRLVPLTGIFLWNRVLWGGLGLLTLAFCFWRFRFNLGSGGGSRPEKLSELALGDLSTFPKPALSFSLADRWSQLTSLFRIEFTATVRNVFFLLFLVTIALYQGMNAWYADSIYQTSVYPVTSVMIDQIGGQYSLLLIALLIFLAGEVVWRERQVRIDQLYDTLPVPKSISYGAKLGSLLMVPVLFQTLMGVLLILVQLFKGFTDIEIGLYIKHLYFVTLPDYILLAVLAFTIQVTVSNKFAGHGVMLGVVILFNFGVLSQLGLEHPLWNYGSNIGLSYSDMNGYGEGLYRHSTYLLHWSLVAVLMLALAYSFYAHGTESGWKARLGLAAERWRQSAALKGIYSLAILGSLVTGFWIYYVTVKIDKYQDEDSIEKEQVALEKKYQHLEEAPMPKITAAKIHAEIYPDELKLDMKGTLAIKNKTQSVIDTVYFKGNSNAQTWTQTFSRPAQEVKLGELEEKFGYRAYIFEPALQPGDSLTMDFTQSFAKLGFDNTSQVRGSGTFFNNNSTVPGIEVPSGNLQDEDKRREYGLKEIPPMPPITDSLAVNTGLFTPDADWINFEITIGTSADQIAVAPGYLQKKWVKKGRAYFHYKMDQPIINFYNVVSARYQVTKDQYEGINIEIYHLPQHAYNVGKMIESIKASLAYYQANFAPYQHKQVRILEFPKTAGTFAQSFANTIPYSEGIGFIANLKDPDDVDYVYYVTAHEMAHQWWAHQAYPAVVRGGQFISETMSQYSALMVMKQKYGLGPMRKFLQNELRSYLTGRSGETKAERALMDVEFQDYIYYRKGSVAMFSLQDYLGEENLNRGLHNFLEQCRLKGPPFPHMGQWYDAVSAAAPPEYRPFLNDQIKNITLYENRILEAKGKVLSKKDSTYEVSLSVLSGKFYADTTGNMPEKPLPIGIPVDIGLLRRETPNQNGDLLWLEKREIAGTDTTRIVLKYKGKKPVFAGIDPITKLVDRNSTDNVTRISWD